MADIEFHRQHKLGLARARKIAWSWAERIERDFGMVCTVNEGEGGDTIEFARSGVNGRVIVAADHFDLQAHLGLLFGVFRPQIEAEIEKQFDALLEASAKAPSKQAATAKKSAAARKR